MKTSPPPTRPMEYKSLTSMWPGTGSCGSSNDREKSEPQKSSESEKELDPPGRAKEESSGHHPYPDTQKSEEETDEQTDG